IMLPAFFLWRELIDRKFKPFVMQVEFGWQRLLIDHGVLTEEGWKNLRANDLEKPSPGYDVVRDGIRLTVLSPTLFYSDSTQRFSTSLSAYAPIDRLCPLPPRGRFACPPTVYMIDGLEGVEFQLRTEESTCGPGDGRICLARLPKGFFSEFFGVELSPKQKARQQKELTERGWQQWEYNHIMHKYVNFRF